VGFVLPVTIDTGGEFCSEVLNKGFRYAEFTGLPKPIKTAPEHLFKWASMQPGFRILNADELNVYWSA
jgi:hypothetical protein